VKNYHLDIIENDDGSINFVRKLKPGSTDKSYGIHVAKLAGIPDDVIIRAFEILEQIEQNDPFRTMVRENGNPPSSEKHYDKILNEKKIELDRFNNKLKSLREKLDTYSEDLTRKEKELEKKSTEIKDLETKTQELKAKASQTQILRKKKYVQTSLFEPAVKKDEDLQNLVNFFKNIDIDTLTPQDLKEKLNIFKKKIENFS
jgi:DNA mismatch repair ATPase MutS